MLRIFKTKKPFQTGSAAFSHPPAGKTGRNELSGYPLIRQLAWLIEQQGSIDIFHELLLINAKVPQMPSMALCLGLAELAATAADKDQNNQNSTQDCRDKSIFHNLFPLEARLVIAMAKPYQRR
jgi:hypothetical protein